MIPFPVPGTCTSGMAQRRPGQLWDSQNPSLQHILSGCKAALTQGRYEWRHDQVLRKLAEILETRRLEANRASQTTSQQLIQFVSHGVRLRTAARVWSLLLPRGECNMRADVDRQLKFPLEITSTSLWPDIMHWSSTRKVIGKRE